MASVKLPDGKQLEIEPGEKARDVAEKIGKRLARDAVVAKLDGELIDLDAPLNGGGDFEVVTKRVRRGPRGPASLDGARDGAGYTLSSIPGAS